MRPTPEKVEELRKYCRIATEGFGDVHLSTESINYLFAEIDALKAEKAEALKYAEEVLRPKYSQAVAEVAHERDQLQARIEKLRNALEQYSSCNIDCQCTACRALAADEEGKCTN